MIEVKIIRKETDPICTRVSLGGNELVGYYVVYRGDLNDVLLVIERCRAAVVAELDRQKRPIMKCPKCKCEANDQVLTPEGPHYGKVICRVCGNFLTWLPRPIKPIDPAKLPKHPEGAPLPQLTGKSAAQVAFGERCRSTMLPKLQDDLSPEVWNAMQTITDCTFWIANMNKSANQLRWPQEWS